MNEVLGWFQITWKITINVFVFCFFNLSWELLGDLTAFSGPARVGRVCAQLSDWAWGVDFQKWSKKRLQILVFNSESDKSPIARLSPWHAGSWLLQTSADTRVRPHSSAEVCISPSQWWGDSVNCHMWVMQMPFMVKWLQLSQCRFCDQTPLLEVLEARLSSNIKVSGFLPFRFHVCTCFTKPGALGWP